MELCVLAQKYNIDLLAIQEHRIVHTDESWDTKTFASATRNNIGADVGGVGILLSPSAKKIL